MLPAVAHDHGRRGMLLYGILALAVTKQGWGCDYDRLHELSNEHRTLRLMLQHPKDDETLYS